MPYLEDQYFNPLKYDSLPIWKVKPFKYYSLPKMASIGDTVFSRLNTPGIYFKLGTVDQAFIWHPKLAWVLYSWANGFCSLIFVIGLINTSGVYLKLHLGDPFDENDHQNETSKSAFQSGYFWKLAPFSCFRVYGKNQTLSKTMTSQYWFQPTRAKENDGIWWFHVFSLHKCLRNILGCQKHVQSYL